MDADVLDAGAGAPPEGLEIAQALARKGAEDDPRGAFDAGGVAAPIDGGLDCQAFEAHALRVKGLTRAAAVCVSAPHPTLPCQEEWTARQSRLPLENRPPAIAPKTICRAPILPAWRDRFLPRKTQITAGTPDHSLVSLDRVARQAGLLTIFNFRLYDYKWSEDEEDRA